MCVLISRLGWSPLAQTRAPTPTTLLFATGVPTIARWAPHQGQGLGLGLYGLGNLGAALGLWLGPVLARAWGWPWVFWALIPPVLAVAGLCYRTLRDAPISPTARPEPSPVLRSLAWLFSFWYFITFGGILAFGGYLPTLYADQYRLSTPAAIASAVLFLVADRYGGNQTLAVALFGIGALASILTLALPLNPFRFPWYCWPSASASATARSSSCCPSISPPLPGPRPAWWGPRRLFLRVAAQVALLQVALNRLAWGLYPDVFSPAVAVLALSLVSWLLYRQLDREAL